MKLGSLFDGSGGFPLAGALNGVKSVWCSEIEPYPIAVTRSRFPNMKHYGDVSKVNGTNIEPVDIITFGSPCQDLSIAGKREGIEDGARSSLFFQAVRIIKEMREETNGAYPRFAVWENVPGAFSSNKGNDFRLVLEALANVSDQEISIPMPEKWQRAGEIVGNGWSIAWRTLDAQYWGVPQRRKRIYLVADFASERAGEVLFERESVCGDTAQSREAGEGIAEDVERGVGGSGVRCLNSDHPQSSRIYDADGVYPCLSSNASGGLNRQAVCYPAGDAEGSAGGSRGFGETGIGYWQNGIQCLRAEGENRPSRPSNVVVSECDDVRCLTPWDCQSKRIFNPDGKWPTLPAMDCGGANNTAIVYALQANGIDRADTAGCNGAGWRENESYALNTVDRHGVVYPNVTGTLCASGAGMNRPAGQGNEADMVVTYQNKSGALCANSHPGSYSGQDAYNDMLIAGKSPRPPRKYIVRRLTPVEAARLQGFPDAWGELAPYDGDDAFWRGVYKTACEIKGSKCPPKKDLRKWYAGLRTDSAEYKMWGNGIALPCAEFVIRSIVLSYMQQ